MEMERSVHLANRFYSLSNAAGHWSGARRAATDEGRVKLGENRPYRATSRPLRKGERYGIARFKTTGPESGTNPAWSAAGHDQAAAVSWTVTGTAAPVTSAAGCGERERCIESHDVSHC